MARGRRRHHDKAWYHIYNRGVGRQDIFREKSDRLLFLDLFHQATLKYAFQLHAYCLMGNHYHLLLYTPEDNISDMIAWSMCQYVKAFNKCHKRDGPLFRSRFGSRLVHDEAYLLRLSAYIHANPIKDGFTEDLDDYRWSSFHAYMGRQADLPSLVIDDLLTRFERIGFPGDYRKFVLAHKDDLAEYFSNASAYIEPILDEGADNKYKLSNDEIVARICQIYGCSLDEIRRSTPGRANPARNMAITLISLMTRATYRTIASYFGDIDPSQISRIVNACRNLPEASYIIREIDET